MRNQNALDLSLLKTSHLAFPADNKLIVKEYSFTGNDLETSGTLSFALFCIALKSDFYISKGTNLFM